MIEALLNYHFDYNVLVNGEDCIYLQTSYQEDVDYQEDNEYLNEVVCNTDFLKDSSTTYDTNTTDQYIRSSKTENTILARDMEMLGINSVDKTCKNILSNKEIVSRLLKIALPEYRGEDLQKIMTEYLENESDTDQFDTNESNTSPSDVRVLRLNTEYLGEEEGQSQLDIKLRVKLPDRENCRKAKKLILEIEGQGDYYPGYALETRGVFYCARMLSEQKGIEIKGDDYGNLCKVASIWVCYDVPIYLQNTISVYRITETKLFGNAERKRENYDLMTVMIVCLGKADDVEKKEALLRCHGISTQTVQRESGSEEDEEKKGDFCCGFDIHNMSEDNRKALLQDCKQLLKLLDIILVEEMELEEKLSLIEQQFGIAMRKTMKGGVNDMYTIGEAMALKAIRKGLDQGRQEGIQQGVQQGIQQGILQGRNETRREMIENMYKNGLSVEMIVLYTGIPNSEVSSYLA